MVMGHSTHAQHSTHAPARVSYAPACYAANFVELLVGPKPCNCQKLAWRKSQFARPSAWLAQIYIACEHFAMSASMLGESDLDPPEWIQCDECAKWRKLPAEYILGVRVRPTNSLL